jgi:uncharacterized protein YciI
MRPIRPALAPFALAALLLAVLPAAAQPPAPAPPAPPGEPAAPPAAQPAPAPAPFVFEQYQLVLLKRPAAPTDYPRERLMEIQQAHLAHMGALGEAGHLVIAGPFSDQEDETLRGLALYQVGSVEEARRMAEADPAVQAGRLEVEVMTWNVEEGYMTFPKRPPVSEPPPSAEGEPAGEPPPPSAKSEPDGR